MPEVLASLDPALPSASDRPVSKSAVTQARQRLGAAPMQSLFNQTARAWCAQDAERHAWKGLSLWAMDGTTFRAPDSADDCLVRMRVSPQARAKSPELPEHWTARAVRMVCASGKQRTLLTSLLDRRRYKAEALAECYRRRWEIETSYRELKQSMLGEALTLRSQQPEGVEQEIWGALIAYNLVRLEMAKAAIQAKVEPTDLSFLRALHILQHEMIWAVGMAPGKLPAHLLRLRTQMQFAIVEKRRGRQCPRLVKALPKRYTVRFLKKDLK